MRIALVVLLCACRMNFDPLASGTDPEADAGLVEAESACPAATSCFLAPAGVGFYATCLPGMGCAVDCRDAATCAVDCANAARCTVTCAPSQCVVTACLEGTCDVDCGGGEVLHYGTTSTCDA